MIQINPEECILERIMEQTIALAESVGEGRSPGVAKHSASTTSELAVSSGQAESL